MSDSKLPRFTRLDKFDPHRKDFVCKHEADANPPITAEAEALFQQALALVSYEMWSENRNYAKAAQLYEQAMKLGHWKAQFNLAGLYLQGLGVEQDPEKSIELTEDLMRKGVPAAWDNMGTMYMGGVGSLKQDATVAYAFWQHAADMGSMASQAYLGAKLLGSHDEPPSFWGNRAIGLKMLECGFAQGSGLAAFELGVTLNVIDEDYSRALHVLHQGTRLGSERSANYLRGAFSRGTPLVNGAIDKSRADRYNALGDALYHNPDLRFPNLDKVLPLPPAPLPQWDMSEPKKLIDAAKAVVPAASSPSQAPTPTSQRTSQLEIVGQRMQSADTRVAQGIAREAEVPTPLVRCSGAGRCLVTGIWQARVPDNHALAASFNQWHRQAYVLEGQPFPDPREQRLDIDLAQVTWTWWNQANHLGSLKIPQVSVGNPPVAG
ncbi:MAG TPA: tetratricopeptide repeat protein [Variovorax sp.]|nr:tetratricopeptide repeat protein [Variovorax sp.]